MAKGKLIKLKAFFGRLAARYVMAAGSYRIWSKLGRFLTQRHGRHLDVPLFRSMDDICTEMRKWTWTHIPWWRNFVPYPGVVWADACKGKYGDCSSFSIFAVAAIRRMAMARPDDVNEWNSIYLLTVMMLKDTGEITAHDLCIFRYSHDGYHYWGHLSNWNRCYPVYSDNNGRFSTVIDVIGDVCRGATCLGWVITSHDMNYTIRGGA